MLLLYPSSWETEISGFL
ncbi:rCG33044 [Rattus norvegicus]|uniref:RCG33044 n=1 Tax=Rattus norvegicus TaxID=10116 RepID=A6HGP4_RAT|nr:rCG33044 [Rattus norvegicus]